MFLRKHPCLHCTVSHFSPLQTLRSLLDVFRKNGREESFSPTLQCYWRCRKIALAKKKMVTATHMSMRQCTGLCRRFFNISYRAHVSGLVQTVFRRIAAWLHQSGSALSPILSAASVSVFFLHPPFQLHYFLNHFLPYVFLQYIFHIAHKSYWPECRWLFGAACPAAGRSRQFCVLKMMMMMMILMGQQGFDTSRVYPTSYVSFRCFRDIAGPNNCDVKYAQIRSRAQYFIRSRCFR